MSAIALWGGVECTVNRVHGRWFDQIQRSGHERRIDDLDRFASLGLSALRFPVLWERHAPESLDQIRLDWADARLDRLRQLDMAPIVGLVHHGSGPKYTSLVDPEFPTKLARYARVVAERYPWVEAWTPVNEPLTTARFSGMYGHWFPHGTSAQVFVRALLTQLQGVVLAMREIRAVNPAARLIQTEDVGVAHGTPAVAAQLAHEADRRWLTWDLLTGRVDRDHPLRQFLLRQGASEHDLAFFQEQPIDPVLGLNYYVTSDRWLDDRVDRYPASSHGGNAEMVYADVEAVRGRPEGLVGHEAHLVAAWERYARPIAITEVHLGCTREEQVRWLLEAWRGAHAAQARGVDVRAVTAWALLGSYDWNTLVTEDRGCYEPGAFDVRSGTPRPTALASAIRNLASAGDLSHPCAEGTGWWRRPTRLLPAVAGSDLPHSPRVPSSPLVVFGATGTLGRAVERIAALRGLPVRPVTRADVDFCDSAAVDALLRRVRPWAVINAAGYVRVDAAEDDPDACHRANVQGPMTLAAACRRRGLPFATFSSDLVFDGRKGAPYVEDDAPAPLNVYGASKAAMEARVRDILPTALIIRTSAFFGPWDDANFATVVRNALMRGHSVDAPCDSTVTPTYVPDLVDAVLDLLIDGEHGVWHLTNGEAMTWLQFGRRVARACGFDPDLVHPARTQDVWAPAHRPPFSALESARGQLLPPLESALERYTALVQEREMFREHRQSS
jgi:dTDP-4-dehydrorhamnose reductase